MLIRQKHSTYITPAALNRWNWKKHEQKTYRSRKQSFFFIFPDNFLMNNFQNFISNYGKRKKEGIALAFKLQISRFNIVVQYDTQHTISVVWMCSSRIKGQHTVIESALWVFFACVENVYLTWGTCSTTLFSQQMFTPESMFWVSTQDLL